jgi:cell wall-associated NlpC family hydrolase
MAMSGGAALAAPDDSEPLMKMLADKGLLAPAAPAAPAPPAATDAVATPAAAPADPGLIRRVQDRASDMVVSAMNFIGVRYRRGGTSAEDGFDCSGFTRHVFEMSLGLVLPRRADEQAAMPGLVRVERNELKPGDLVFFNTMRRTFSHVGIYIGDNRFVHAPSQGKDVRTDDMTFGYWAKRFTGARRAELPASTQAALAAPAEPATH